MEEIQQLTLKQKFSNFVKECVRVFRVTKKPSKEEFLTILKVSLLGVGIIGFIGFLISFINALI